MMNENNFINEVWDKYDLYLKNPSKDNFFKKHQYQNKDIIRNINTVLSLFLVIVSCVGIVYASSYIYNEIYQVFSNISNREEFNANEFYNDMTLEDDVYYMKVLNYEDYIKSKERFGNIVEMSKEDFESNFAIIISLEKFEYSKSKIVEVYADSTTLYVVLDNINESSNIDNNILSAKIDRNYLREEIKINFLYEKPSSESYIPLEELPNNYSKEQAIEDGCFVIMNNEIISSNEEQIIEFEKNVNNNKEAFIRIVTIIYNEKNKIKESIIIRDIQYKNGEFLVAYDQTRTNDYIIDNTRKDYIYEKSKGSLKTKYYSNHTIKTYYIEKIDDENIYMKNSSYNIIPICSYNEKSF